MTRNLLLGLAIAALSLSLSGCGGGSTTVKNVDNQTAGQQLLDLKKAHDEGIISDKEYEKARKEILEDM